SCGTGPCEERPGSGQRSLAALPLRRVWLRGPPALLAMPRLPGLGQLPGPARRGALSPGPKQPGCHARSGCAETAPAGGLDFEHIARIHVDLTDVGQGFDAPV